MVMVAAASAMAVNGPIPFGWSNVEIGGNPVTIANIPGAVLSPGELLVGVRVTFGGIVEGSISVTPLENTAAKAFMNGTHLLAFGSFNPVDSDPVTANSGQYVGIEAGKTAVLSAGPVPIGPGGTTALNLSNFLNPPYSTIPVTLAFSGGIVADLEPGTFFSAQPLILSSGEGSITYLVRTVVPEGETYVAGLALIGLVGFGYYRRSQRV